MKVKKVTVSYYYGPTSYALYNILNMKHKIKKGGGSKFQCACTHLKFK